MILTMTLRERFSKIKLLEEIIRANKKEIVNLKRDVKFFNDLYSRNTLDKEIRDESLITVDNAENFILGIKKNMEIQTGELNILQRELKNFITDAKDGNWYNNETGEIINMEPTKEIPEGAFNPL